MCSTQNVKFLGPLLAGKAGYLKLTPLEGCETHIDQSQSVLVCIINQGSHLIGYVNNDILWAGIRKKPLRNGTQKMTGVIHCRFVRVRTIEVDFELHSSLAAVQRL